MISVEIFKFNFPILYVQNVLPKYFLWLSKTSMSVVGLQTKSQIILVKLTRKSYVSSRSVFSWFVIVTNVRFLVCHIQF